MSVDTNTARSFTALYGVEPKHKPKLLQIAAAAHAVRCVQARLLVAGSGTAGWACTVMAIIIASVAAATNRFTIGGAP